MLASYSSSTFDHQCRTPGAPPKACPGNSHAQKCNVPSLAHPRAAILNALAAGTTLVIDRYSYSGIAYTSAKLVPHLDMEWCRASESGLPAPDLLIFMTLPPEVAATRGGYGEERYEKAAFQKQVRKDASYLFL